VTFFFMPTSKALTVVLMLAGGGVGIFVAHQHGIISWLNAKLYLVVGAVAAAAAAFLLARIRG
jgi:uncharacterized membrane protein YfcA